MARFALRLGLLFVALTAFGGSATAQPSGTIGYSLPANRISNSTFWTSKVSGVTPNGNGFTDPRIYYDSMSQRWFAVEITTTASDTNNRIMIARSDTSAPRGSWKGLTVNSPSGQFSDFPTLAVDANGVYVGTNNFGGSGTRSF